MYLQQELGGSIYYENLGVTLIVVQIKASVTSEAQGAACPAVQSSQSLASFPTDFRYYLFFWPYKV